MLRPVSSADMVVCRSRPPLLPATKPPISLCPLNAGVSSSPELRFALPGPRGCVGIFRLRQRCTQGRIVPCKARGMAVLPRPNLPVRARCWLVSKPDCGLAPRLPAV